MPSPVESSSPLQPTCAHIQRRYTGVTGSSRKNINLETERLRGGIEVGAVNEQGHFFRFGVDDCSLVRSSKLRYRRPSRMAEICLDRQSEGFHIRVSLRSIRPSIGTKNPIPEEMDHREIAVRVPMMNEMQFLFPSEPCKSLKPRSLYVVFLIEKDVRVERRRTRDSLSHEQIDWQHER